MSTTALEVQNLSFSYQDHHALSEVSFDLEYGQIIGLLGPNGAGKTTTLKLITGLLALQQGDVLINSSSIIKNHHYKNKIGFITDQMKFPINLTIKEGLTFFAELRDLSFAETSQRIDELAQRFYFDKFLNKRFSTLSSGQKQKALLCASIIHSPRILLYDEVTSSIDVMTSRQILNFLLEERKKGKAILFSTHNLSEVEYLCDDFYILNEGRLLTKTNCPTLKSKYSATNIFDAFCLEIEKSQREAA